MLAETLWRDLQWFASTKEKSRWKFSNFQHSNLMPRPYFSRGSASLRLHQLLILLMHEQATLYVPPSETNTQSDPSKYEILSSYPTSLMYFSSHLRRSLTKRCDFPAATSDKFFRRMTRQNSIRYQNWTCTLKIPPTFKWLEGTRWLKELAEWCGRSIAINVHENRLVWPSYTSGEVVNGKVDLV